MPLRDHPPQRLAVLDNVDVVSQPHAEHGDESEGGLETEPNARQSKSSMLHRRTHEVIPLVSAMKAVSRLISSSVSCRIP